MPKYISVFLCSFIVGVGTGSLYAVHLNAILFPLLGAMLFAMAVLTLKKEAGIILCCLSLGLAFGLAYVNKSFDENEYLENFNQKYFETEGVIISDPIISGRNQQITLLPDGYTQYVRASLYTPIPDAHKGDRVWIRGRLQSPENFSGFDYIGYLQRWKVFAVLKNPRIIILHRANFNWRTPLLAFREYAITKAKAFPTEEGALIVGMLIGQRQNIPEEVANSFKTTGLTHIVAVSGFNMTIIATACGALVWYIGRRATNLTTIAIVFGFVVVTGASAAVVRAAIMATLMVCAQLLGRQYASLYSLLLVSFIMVLLNPRILIWDVGFQLSVAATFGVLISFRIKNPDSATTVIGELLRPTIGAIIFTAPIIAYHFKTFSVIAPLANLLVLPFVPWIMLLGALAMLPVFGTAFVFPAQLMTSAILQIAMKLSKIPYASISVEFPVWAFTAYYVFALSYVYLALQRREKRGRLKKIITYTT
jgi:competence protein ComEC